MLFNSYIFLFGFLPAALVGFYLLRWLAPAAVVGWLLMSSLIFYGYWDVWNVPLLVGSIIVNYAIGLRLAAGGQARLATLVFGLAIDLGLIAYFKYAAFIAANVSALTGWAFVIQVGLPLAISFFTFQQIAYLVDCYRGQPAERNLIHYAFFIAFFPHLIAGPIVLKNDLLTQLPEHRLPHDAEWWFRHLACGVTLFAFGLFKKTMIADTAAPYATEIFAAAEQGAALSVVESWGGALAYTLQIYFDFSGYSDMAIGLALMFGFKLPINFDSPYKATSIIDFWRRWHISLSRFLREYLYIPLGGNRLGATRWAINLMIVMGLGGLWHGAAWTFVLWGLLHGVYLLINHLWRHMTAAGAPGGRVAHAASWAITFVAIVVAWVLFKAQTVAGAGTMLKAMAFANTWTVDRGGGQGQGYVVLMLLAGMLALTLALPNTQQILRMSMPALSVPRVPSVAMIARIVWHPNLAWALAVSALLFGTVSFIGGRYSEFIYFNF
jgi:alginate O-acetyltransferase complex protein AlgI